MNKDAAATFQPRSDEGIAGREVLQDVFVLEVIHIDNVMAIRTEQVLIERQPQG